MQNDLPHQQDPSPHPDPASPTFPSLHRRHQPTRPAEPYRDTSPSGSSLRRRAVPREGDIIRVDIRSPFGDGGSRIKEGFPIHRATTIRELKDGIAEGQYGERAIWIREGMRIVWQGRIVRDEEAVGDVVANVSYTSMANKGKEGKADEQGRSSEVVHTLHLVARRLGGTPAIGRVGSGYFNQALPVPTEPMSPVVTPRPVEVPAIGAESPAPEGKALLDSIHYLLFTARHHLFHLLGREPLKWADTVPPPLVDQAIAREAVMSVVRTVVDARPAEERRVWRGWEEAFGDDHDAGVGCSGDRDGLEEEVRSIWRDRVGRVWDKSDKGQIVDVEIDQTVFQLHLPQLSVLTPSQLAHLRTYLRITALLPMLYPFLPQPVPETPQHLRPTPTIPLPAPRPTFTSTLATAVTYIPRIPLPVLSHMFFSAVKLVAMLWMMTQGMAWSDRRLWIIGGAATGWWVADGWQRYIRERPRVPPQIPVQAGAGPGQNDGPGVPAQGAAAVNPPGAPAVPAVGSARLAPHLAIPLIHLSTDTAQLRLINDTMNPTRQVELAQTPAPPLSRPPWIVTQLLLPISLWFITLIPEFEAIRTRAIRRRERSMRVLVGELNAAPPVAPETDAAGTGAEGEETAAEGEETAVEGEETAAAEGAPPPAELILPQGLNEVARKYYLRTMERGEGIDWEEEREAQRAMGIGREEEDAGGGFLGMF